MSLRFVVIGEARADFTPATELADRVLLERVDWLEDSTLSHQRHWVGEMPAGEILTWTSIANLARAINIRVHGHFAIDPKNPSGAKEPGLPDAKAARRAIAYVRHQLSQVDAILLIRDVDDQRERRAGLEQARVADSAECEIVIGIAIIERESWVVSGFQAQNPAEVERLLAETENLGWNPCLKSHALTAGKDDTALRSPKRVLASLVGTDGERQRACWMATPLQTLRERGTDNGLADYLAEIANRLVPLITGH